jgi:formiminotetrahydrofolate cyclodeaminase
MVALHPNPFSVYQLKTLAGMTIDLSTLPFKELMQKFDTGGHKPGSGSAVAILGITSCALTKAVIRLSRVRREYQDSWTKLESILTSITDEIEPALWRAFRDDPEQFDKVIRARQARDIEQAPFQRWELARQALSELRAANEILLVIAEKCLLLAEHAITVFDIGFKSARGDSGVAIESALSGATGAISIVYLNLKSFSGQVHPVEQIRRAEQLEGRASDLKSEPRSRILGLKSAAERSNASFTLDLNVIRDPTRTETEYSDLDIKEIARVVQNELWINRAEIWTNANSKNKLSVLDPSAAFRAFGYEFETLPSLGQFTEDGEVVEIAGYINKRDSYAAVSKTFPPNVRQFTAAHELGHAVLHKANEQYRDRALDGTMDRGRRPPSSSKQINSLLTSSCQSLSCAKPSVGFFAPISL